MSNWLYRKDIDDVRDRLTSWWGGGDLGRPALLLTAPRQEPLEDIPVMAEPEGWLTEYSISNFDYRVYLAASKNVNTTFLAESVPMTCPDVAPNSLACYLGCNGIDQPGTVWCEPFIKQTEDAKFAFDSDNRYWDFTLRLAKELLRIGEDKVILQFPDLIEGLDTLAAMRGTESLLMDLIERPEWVHQSLQPITELYFQYYDILYDMMKDERGGSYFWTWAPGRISKLQCDFSAMISPDMFEEFMMPVLTEMTGRLDYSLYHLDGEAAIGHLEHLLKLPRMNMIQWTAGAGAAPPNDPQWWPLYHRIVEAGKTVYIVCPADEDVLLQLKKEFGEKLKRFMLVISAESTEQANRVTETLSS